jgi:hypothetical protein
MIDSELNLIKARLDLMERKLEEVLRRQGMTDTEFPDFELDEAIDIGARTLNFTAIKETLKKRIAQREGWIVGEPHK